MYCSNVILVGMLKTWNCFHRQHQRVLLLLTVGFGNFQYTKIEELPNSPEAFGVEG